MSRATAVTTGLILRKSQIFLFVAIIFVCMIGISQGKKLTPLVCNSVNDLQEMNVQTDLVYVTTRGRECTFVFEGPPASLLDIKVHSFSTEGNAKSNCKNPPVRLFTYNVKNKLRQYEKVLCTEDDSVRTVTDGNTAVITSNLHYGSFFVRVTPISSLIDPRLREKTKRISNFIKQQQRKTDPVARRRNDLIKFTTDAAEQTDIDGMFPPNLQSIDFFAMMNQFEIPVQFRAQPQGFTPSLYFPSPGQPRPTDSYGAPVTSGPILWGVYPGQPGADISITSTQRPAEWIGSQPLVSGGGLTGYPDGRPSTSRPLTDKLTEATTEPSSTRYTEPLTNPTTPSAPLSSSIPPLPPSSAQPPTSSTERLASSSAVPEQSTENASNELPSTTTTVTNTTVITTEVKESEQQKMIKSQIAQNSEGFKPMKI